MLWGNNASVFALKYRSPDLEPQLDQTLAVFVLKLNLKHLFCTFIPVAVVLASTLHLQT